MIENGKPAPDIYIEAASKLELSSKEYLVIEDSKNGILSGSRAGWQSVLIPDAIPIDDEMLKACDYEFDNLIY